MELSIKSFTIDKNAKRLHLDMKNLDSDSIGLISPTGIASKWVKFRTEEDFDEVLYTEFIPNKESLHDFPELKGWAMTIFNK